MNSSQKTLRILNKWGVKTRLLNHREKQLWIRKWKRAFLVPIPKRISSKSIYGQFFHTFSYGLTPCLENRLALKTYSKQKQNTWTILLWDGDPERVIVCSSKALPTSKQLEKLRDIQESCADIHLTSTDLKWTFCITHESECGPYFSQPFEGWRSKLNIDAIKRKLGPKTIDYLNGN